MINHLIDEISIDSFIDSIWTEDESGVVIYLYKVDNHLLDCYLTEITASFFNSDKICFKSTPYHDVGVMSKEEVILSLNPFLKEIEEIAVNYRASEQNQSNLLYGDKMKLLFPGYSGELIDLFRKRKLKSINGIIFS